jgi:predicted DNA-binding transcriptional regulator YafY
MNRMDRLLAMLLVLQRRKLVRAEDLAARFEISKRTVYRDVTALSEMGVPVVAQPGEGYSLMEGYFLPPLLFTPDEAAALFLGAKWLAAQATGKLPQSTEGALTKLAHVLPQQTLDEVGRFTDVLHFFIMQKPFNLDDPTLTDLQWAINERRAVQITYHSLQSDEITTRVIEPTELTYGDGAWYVTGYCRLRQGRRSFRLNRIEQYKLLTERFTPKTITTPPAEVIMVKVRFAPAVLRWVQERQHYAFVRQEGDCLIYQVHTQQEIQSWLFGWGTAVEVLEPETLRSAMRVEAKKLFEMLT